MNSEQISTLVSTVDLCEPAKLGRPSIKYLDIAAVDNTLKRIIAPQTIAVDSAPSRARQPVNAGDVIVSTVRPNLNACAIVPPELDGEVASTGFCVLRSQTDKLWPQYLFYFVQSVEFVRHLTNIATGASYPAVTDTDILEMCIPLPSLPEQQRIAAQLDQADRLRRTRRYALELSDGFLPAAFLEMFGDLRTNPHGFDIEELGDVCDVRDGTHDSPKFHSTGFPLVTSKNLVNGFVDLTDTDLISEADFRAINKRSKVDRGDILMPMIGTIGNPVLVDHDPNYAIKNVALIKFVEHSPLPTYIRELLRGFYFDYITARKSRGGTQKFIALGDIRAFPIPLPPAPLQEKFHTLLKRHEHLRSVQRESLRQADHLFHSLLHEAFASQSD